MSTNEEQIIFDEIAYMDGIIESEGNRNIKSIYYNKAQLLYRLKKYDDAMMTLYQTDNDDYDVYKAALLILLRCDTEAQKLLDKQIEKNKNILYEFSEDQIQVNSIIMGTVILYVLSDMSVDSFFSELIDSNIITQKYLDEVLKTQIVQKNDILRSMWPD